LIVGGGNDFQLNGLLFSLFYLYALPTAFVRFEEVRFMVVLFQIFERQHRVVTRIQPMDRKVPTLVSTIFLVEITTLAASSFELGSYSSRILWGQGCRGLRRHGGKQGAIGKRERKLHPQPQQAKDLGGIVFRSNFQLRKYVR
jgi:hypothetical protein